MRTLPIWNDWKPRKPWRTYELPPADEWPELYVRVDSERNPGNYWYGLRQPLPEIPWPPAAKESDDYDHDAVCIAELNRRIRAVKRMRTELTAPEIRTPSFALHTAESY